MQKLFVPLLISVTPILCHPEHGTSGCESESRDLVLCRQSTAKSLYSGLNFSIRRSFFSLRQFFSCFSLAIALCTLLKHSQYTNRVAR